MWGRRSDTSRTIIEPIVYQIPGFVFKKFVSIKVELKYAVLERIIENKNPEIRKGSIERIVLCIGFIISFKQIRNSCEESRFPLFDIFYFYYKL